MEVREDEFRGFRRITISNTQVSVSMLPQVGGKLVSLKHLPSGREWLHLNPHFVLREPVYGASYVQDFDSGGWDECCPSVSAEMHEDVRVPIPDHGEVWGLPWHCDVERNAHSVVLRGWVSSPNFPFEFHRDISLTADSPQLNFSYYLRNTGSQKFRYLWCAHPILSIEEGMVIALEPSAPVRVNGDDNIVAGVWPELSPGTRIDIVGARDSGIARKLFVGPLTDGSATVITPRGEKLKFSFDPTQLPFVGLWQNYGGWSGNEAYPAYYNMGVEPCSGMRKTLSPTRMPDSLQNAMKWRTNREVQPQGEVGWSLRVELTEA